MPWDLALIFFVLAVIVPWRGRVRLRKLLAMPHVGTVERLSLYASTIAFQWFGVAVVAWRAWAHGYTAVELGLTAQNGRRLLVASILGAASIASLHWLNLRRLGRLPASAREAIQPIAERILPRSSIELYFFLALAITAGLCEEFLYRGFAMAALGRLGLPVALVIVLSSILFGLAHLYQGKGGFISTMLVGAVFGIGRTAFNSLVPVIFWHGAVDVVAGVAGPRYLTPSPTQVADATT